MVFGCLLLLIMLVAVRCSNMFTEIEELDPVGEIGETDMQ